MKKLLLIPLLVFGTALFAQDYNKWSIEAGAGMPIAGAPWTDGYHYKNNILSAYDFGVRYMSTNRFGLKLTAAFNSFENRSMDPAAYEFESEFGRVTLEGVVNLNPILGFRKSFGVLAHAGAGYGVTKGTKPVKADEYDQNGLVIVGITPQLRLGKRAALHVDYSLIGAMRLHHNWDGRAATTRRGLNGTMTNLTAGLTVYLGKQDVHADWYNDEAVKDDKLAALEARVAKIETDMLDSDGDGVPDYLDQEPNTPAGAYVDTKGRQLDANNNNIPDYMEAALDDRYALKGECGDCGDGVVKKLIDSGLINVYFPFNSTKPHGYSSHAMNYVIKYMKDNPEVQIELVGYADVIGGQSAYNQRLSENRAKVVYNVLLASGISADRLSHRGAGVDTSADKSSEGARQLVRRVIFEIK